jgi:alkylation response protein AidB-like acyl-CoA dehydrogenase
MNFLNRERRALERYLPSLHAKLAELPLAERESPGSPAIPLYRELRGASLLIPERFGGSGLTPLAAIETHRAVGSVCPSLAIAMTMHNFSVATLVEYCFYGDYTVDLLRQISELQLLVASGFAEGRTGTSILDPLMRAEPVEGGYRVTGRKNPCSLSRSMHLLTASVAVPNGNGNGARRAVAIIPADSEGIERNPFWKSLVLRGAESDQLVLRDVFVAADQVFFPEIEETLDAVEAGGFLWFELLVSASYLGIASGLAERVVAAGKGEPCERTQLVIDLEGAMSALEGVAHSMTAGERGEALLARAMYVRYAVQQAIERAAVKATELLGGMAFINSPDVAYLFAATRALAFHPPSRLSISRSLDAYAGGQPLQVV